MNEKQLLEELENKKRQGRIMSKKVVVCIVAAMLLCAFLYGAIAVVESGWLVSVELEDTNKGFIFNPVVDYGYNIMEDAGYLRLLADEPLISYCDLSTGVTETIAPENYDDQKEAVKFLINLVLCIQSGDYEGYYNSFTDAYRAVELEKNEYAELEFTMQQVYSAVITCVSEVENEQTGTLSCVYRLKYKIRNNNGTFRTDLGSDSYREQELVILNSASDPTLKINSVSTEKTLIRREVVHVWRVVALVLASVVLIGGVSVGAVLLVKRIGKATQNEDKSEEEIKE